MQMYASIRERVDSHVKIERFPREYVYLATCHRQEVYNTEPVGIEGFERLEGKQVVRHLLEVVSGIRSFIIGETEILGQVRDALEASQKSNAVNDTLYKLFRSASNFGAKVRRETKISSYKSSIVSIALEQMDRKQKIGVLGCGFLGKTMLKNLARRKFGDVVCSSRNIEKARNFSDYLGYMSIPFYQKDKLFEECDVVVVALSQNVKIELPVGSKAFVIDLGNNVSSGNRLNVMNLSDMKRMEGEMRKAKEKEVEKVVRMINEETERVYEKIGG